MQNIVKAPGESTVFAEVNLSVEMATLNFVVNKSARPVFFSSLFTLLLTFVVTFFTLYITTNISIAVVFQY